MHRVNNSIFRHHTLLSLNISCIPKGRENSLLRKKKIQTNRYLKQCSSPHKHTNRKYKRNCERQLTEIPVTVDICSLLRIPTQLQLWD